MASAKLDRLCVNLTGTEDSDADQIELNRTDHVYRRSRKVFQFSLSFTGCDVFPARPTSERLNYLTTSECRLLQATAVERDNQTEASVDLVPDQVAHGITCRRVSDWLAQRWTKISYLIFAYLSARALLSFALRFVIHSLRKKSKRSPSVLRTLVLHQFERLLELYGDPFCAIPQLTPLIYTGPPLTSLLLNFCAPYYFRTVRPLDCSVARFLLHPKGEARRIDVANLEKVDIVLDEVERRRKEISNQLEMSHAFRTPNEDCTKLCERARMRVHLVRLMNQSNSLKHFKHNVHLIRPKAFKSEWHRCCYRNFLIFFFAGLSTNVFVLSSCEAIIDFFGWKIRCDQRISELHQAMALANQTAAVSCGILEMFTLSEVLQVVELNITLNVFISSSLALFLTLNLQLIQHQLHLIEGTTENLARLLRELRNFGRQMDAMQQLEAEQVLSASQLDSLMHENIIGLWLFEAESRRNVASVAYLTDIFVLLIFEVTLVSFGIYNSSFSARSVVCKSPLTSEPYESHHADLGMVVISIWLVVWIYTNLLMFLCAIIPARVLGLKKLVTSIVAQTIYISDRERLQQEQMYGHERPRRTPAGSSRQERPTHRTPVSFWLKLALSGNFAREIHSVRVFGLKVTHGKALELNFYVAALISWLNSKYTHS